MYTFEKQPPFLTTCVIHKNAIHSTGGTLTNLRGGVEYAKISVRCYNSVGWSKSSKEIECVQLPDIGVTHEQIIYCTVHGLIQLTSIPSVCLNWSHLPLARTHTRIHTRVRIRTHTGVHTHWHATSPAAPVATHTHDVGW